MDSFKEEDSFVIFDTETTGLSPEGGDAIIEIAGQKVVNREIVDEFNTLVNSGVRIDPMAEVVHGISNEHVLQFGRPLHEVIPEFMEFCNGCVLVGHNIIRFDLKFLKKHSHELGLPPVKHKAIDTLFLAKSKLFLQSYKLGSLALYFGISYDGAHRALADVDINRQVFFRLVDL